MRYDAYMKLEQYNNRFYYGSYYYDKEFKNLDEVTKFANEITYPCLQLRLQEVLDEEIPEIDITKKYGNHLEDLMKVTTDYKLLEDIYKKFPRYIFYIVENPFCSKAMLSVAYSKWKNCLCLKGEKNCNECSQYNISGIMKNPNAPENLINKISKNIIEGMKINSNYIHYSYIEVIVKNRKLAYTHLKKLRAVMENKKKSWENE